MNPPRQIPQERLSRRQPWEMPVSSQHFWGIGAAGTARPPSRAPSHSQGHQGILSPPHFTDGETEAHKLDRSIQLSAALP